LIALGRQKHHPSLLERFAEPTPLRGKPIVLETMCHRLKTRRGRKLYALRKCSVEPVFGLIKHVMKFGNSCCAEWRAHRANGVWCVWRGT
jgi:hypothetical protein